MSAGARSRLDGRPSSDLPAGHSLRLLRPSATADAALERLRGGGGGGGGVSLSSRLAAFLPQLAAANAALEARVAAGGDAAATAVNIEAVPEGAAHIAMVRRRRASPRRCLNRGAASARWQHRPRRSPPPPLPLSPSVQDVLLLGAAPGDTDSGASSDGDGGAQLLSAGLHDAADAETTASAAAAACCCDISAATAIASACARCVACDAAAAGVGASQLRAGRRAQGRPPPPQIIELPAKDDGAPCHTKKQI